MPGRILQVRTVPYISTQKSLRKSERLSVVSDMQILREIPLEEKAAIGETVLQMICDTANMPLKEKEQWLSKIPKDYRIDNDMTIVKYRIWNEIRQNCIDKGYLGVVKTEDGQQALNI